MKDGSDTRTGIGRPLDAYRNDEGPSQLRSNGVGTV